MNIVFASAHPYLPQIAGGSQSNTHEMTRELLARGHEVSVLAGLTLDGWIGTRSRVLMKLSRRKAICDRSQGYPVFRSWFAWEGAADVVRSVAPDVIVAQSGKILRVAKAFRDLGLPTVIYLHNVEFEDHGEPIEDFRDAIFLANSQFTADRYQDACGIRSTVINPLFQPERYKVASRRERVLFVNPHPLKGVDLAIALARACPDIPFDFVESWTLSNDQRSSLQQGMAGLGNVTLHPRTDDMREHYRRARIVLVPSRWEETWGRIASEAHYSGIPVLGTRIGGLTEAVGPGGILLPPQAELSEWVEALRSLWEDSTLYETLSQVAMRYAERPELDRTRQIDQMEEILAKAANSRAVEAA
ncbi:glycosyltransferase involved in cell wall biosynthesis [Mesorhizobium sp. J18]|uniref:glycosyltransferase n=1 Tax=Mesorhizobium sp. J18 TaxID=935263 RepID=UPI00119BB9E8|nr:glycosyltransferase [Mesorhizobium sp. J18]TWG97930.1 glycosyltransferase involved in cell wall biosynthesis [Mesorhizobium sp. J18]